MPCVGRILVYLGDALRQPLKTGEIVVGAGLIEEALCKRLPGCFIELAVGLARRILAQRFTDLLPKLVVGHGCARKAQYAEAGMQKTLFGQMKERRDQLALGQIAGSAKDDEQIRR